MPIHLRLEKKGLRAGLLDAPTQLTVQRKMHLLTTVRARGSYLNLQVLVP